MYKTDSRHKKYWQNRHNEPGFDWKKAYFDGWNHPHRYRIIEALKRINFSSVLEVGCATGPNLHLIRQVFKGVRFGGVDISAEAIRVAKTLFPEAARLAVDSADDLFLTDGSVDVILADMTLIYLSRKKFIKALKEIHRVTRKHIIFVEFHHTNPLKRLALKLLSGYNSYNYIKELKKLEFYDVELRKITEQDWPGGQPQKDFAWIITAKKSV